MDTSVLELDTTPYNEHTVRGFEIYNKYNSLNTVEACFSFQVTALNVFIWHTNQTNNKYIPDLFGRKFGKKKINLHGRIYNTTHNTCPDDGTRSDTRITAPQKGLVFITDRWLLGFLNRVSFTNIFLTALCYFIS